MIIYGTKNKKKNTVFDIKTQEFLQFQFLEQNFVVKM